MCGIFSILNIQNHSSSINIANKYLMTETCLNEYFQRGKQRGPEHSELRFINKSNVCLGFHRLAINGLNSQSNQPFCINGIMLICNGEIYNYKQLYHVLNITPVTESDCEVIIHMYLTYGIEHTLATLDGVFAFVLFDTRCDKLIVARDPFGVRPLYYLLPNTTGVHFPEDKYFAFASELKSLEWLYNRNTIMYTVNQFEPGTYMELELMTNTWHHSCAWKISKQKTYFIPSFSFSITSNEREHSIAQDFNEAVKKRCNTTDRPVACLLSGGLDSSLVAALVADYFKQTEKKRIETYSIGLAESEDIKYAQIVANYIGSIHTEIIVTEKEMFDAIPEVIYAIESFDTTTVRASIGNYLIGKYIAAHSNAKVIFNGDGSDELFGGYLYMNQCPDDIEFDKESRRLLKDIHLFDVLRSDKCISSNGLEPRTPFLDRAFVNSILCLPSCIRNHTNKVKVQKNTDTDAPKVRVQENTDTDAPKVKVQEKYLLRQAFKIDHFGFENIDGNQILPGEILERKKEAFSDGVSGHQRSLFTILQEYIAAEYNAPAGSIELEKRYYKDIFDKMFPNCSHIVPYYWMQKYSNSTDPSARTLTTYS